VKWSDTLGSGIRPHRRKLFRRPPDPCSRSLKTDASGEFDFHRGLQLGTYKVYARKDADAYPDRSLSFYADPKVEITKVDLTDDDRSATVEVTLGEKAGVLVGRVIDADSGVALRAKLAFIDEDGNADSVFANGKYANSCLRTRI